MALLYLSVKDNKVLPRFLTSGEKCHNLLLVGIQRYAYIANLTGKKWGELSN